MDDKNISTTEQKPKKYNNTIELDEAKEESKPVENPVVEEEEEEQRIQRQELINDYKYKKFLNEIPLPTTDDEIKKLLHKLNEPEELYNEKNYERRDRLSEVIFTLIKSYKGNLPDDIKKLLNLKKKTEITKIIEEEFFTEASDDLVNFRKKLILFSLLKAKNRLKKQKKISNDNYIQNINKNFNNNEKYNRNFSSYDYTLCQIGDERGISMGVLSPDGKMYATSGWSGTCNLFISENLNPILKLNGHKERLNSVSFYDNKYSENIKNNNDYKYQLLTTSNDRNIILWNIKENDNKNYIYDYITLKGHEDRTRYAEFHTMGNHIIGSCSNDCTFRLWDLNKITQKEILIQEGHKYPINYFKFHEDGNLLITCDSGSFIYLWDLRCGRKIENFCGHVDSVQKCKFDANTYMFYSCSADNTIKIWDIRRGKYLYNLAAHNEIITDFCVDKMKVNYYYNKYLFTCSFDKSIKIWDCNNYSMIHKFDILNNDKFVSIDVSADCNKIFSTSLSKNIKVIENINVY